MTMSANTLRGEAAFTIGNETVRLRPSFENLVAAEEELGSLFAMVERAAGGSLTLAEITSLLWHCMDSETRFERSDVGSAVIEMGLVNATAPVRVILAQVLQGKL